MDTVESPVAALRAVPKIDIHAHLFSRGDRPAEEEMVALVRTARYWNVRRVVILGNVVMGEPDMHDPSPDSVRTINTHTMAALDAYPDFFIGFCYLSGANPVEFTMEEIERCIVEGGMRGIKLWMSVKASDTRLDPIVERAAELGVPVLQHTWYQVGSAPESESTPADLAHLGRRFPQATIIMAHLGGGGCRGVLDIAEVPNIHVDTAGSQPEAGLVDYAVRRLGPERVAFGSDWPLRDVGAQVGRAGGDSLTAEQRGMVFMDNATRLLRIDRTPQ